jgi:hypothetical protein
MIIDLFVILLLELGHIKSKTLVAWYHKFHIGAFVADVLSLVIGITLARLVYTYFNWSWNISLFLVVAVLVQLMHDLLFAKLFYAFPRGVSKVLDAFKDYANELGATILLADAQMIIGTAVLATLLSSLSTNANIFLLIIVSYMVPYFVFSV